MSPTREERKEVITRQRRQQILDAALDIFSRKGFTQATTAEIARTAGIAEGTIYKYFQNKRELMVAVIKTFAAGRLIGLSSNASFSTHGSHCSHIGVQSSHKDVIVVCTRDFKDGLIRCGTSVIKGLTV